MGGRPAASQKEDAMVSRVRLLAIAAVFGRQECRMGEFVRRDVRRGRSRRSKQFGILPWMRVYRKSTTLYPRCHSLKDLV